MEAERLTGDRLSITCEIDSTPDAVRSALRQIHEHLSAAEPTQGTDPSWEIVVAEVLNNIVEHAYQERPGGEIRVCLHFSPGTLHAEFTDFGRPMPQEAPPEGKPADLDVPVEDLPEGGFGWFLIRTMTTQLDYAHTDGANLLKLEIPLAECA